ncbi:MAG: hypothetical protein PVJ57_05830 [Phycisphaerae bacterium]
MLLRCVRHRLAGWFTLLLCAGLCCLTGCTWITYLGTDATGSEHGRTYYVGGAGPFGHIGTIDVPHGLRQAGYEGSLEVFGWQGLIPSHLRDQIDRSRNEEQAHRLAQRVEAYLRHHPACPVNIIALSAGTGITTWALENLPDELQVNNVVFLGSSMSRDYDLRPALRHVRGRLYNFYSPDDPVLLHAVPITGSVDRRTRGINVAGLFGFAAPTGEDTPVAEVYGPRLRNMPYRKHYRDYGYDGMHTDGTSAAFVEHILAPLLLSPEDTPSP